MVVQLRILHIFISLLCATLGPCLVVAMAAENVPAKMELQSPEPVGNKALANTPNATKTASTPQDPAGPLTLNTAIQATFANHHALRVAQEQYIAAQHNKRVVQSGYGPSITMYTSADKKLSNSSKTRVNGKTTTATLGLDSSIVLDQMLWDGFATRSRVASSDAQLRGSKFSLSNTTESLAFTTLNALNQAQLSLAVLELTKGNVARHKEIIIRANERVNYGLDTIADLSKAKSRLAQAQITLITSKASLKNAKKILVRLTALPEPTEFAPIPEPTQYYDSSEQALNVAITNNPALANLKTNIDAATGAKKLAESAYSPQANLSLSADYNTQHDAPNSSYDKSLTALGSGQWNVFNSGADSANVSAREANLLQNQAILKNSIDQMKLDIENAMTTLAAAHEQFKYWTEAVGYNKTTLTMYTDQFMLGERTLLDVLNAENELYSSQVQAITNKSQTILLAYRILLLTGEFLPSLAIPTNDIFAKTATLSE